ncbi:MAG: GAF domain-containing protein [Gammaproteobacteria bacterium]|nr:GAF domain-containing protein [Gammaproteobacteria bacterium]
MPTITDSTKTPDLANRLFAKLGKIFLIGHGFSHAASHRFRYLLISLGGIFALQLVILLFHTSKENSAHYPLLMTMILAVFGVALLFALVSTFYRDLIDPTDRFKQWSRDVRSGGFDTRLPDSGMGELQQTSNDINNLMDYLEAVFDDMEVEVNRQTTQFEQKNRSLQLLYDIATGISTSRDLNDLLTRFLHTMRDIINAKAGMVRLIQENGDMELISSFGLSDEVIESEQCVPVKRCLCGSAAASGEIQMQLDLKECHKIIGIPIVGDEDLEMLAVPLQYHGKTLGIYNLFIPSAGAYSDDEIHSLFASVGQHLGMAIEKTKLDDEAKRLTIIRERNAIAHELHDSLAQTLASLRFQVSMLDETIDTQKVEEIHTEIQQIKGGLDEAYSELRELLAHFRTPVHRRDLMPALEDLISNFRKQTGMHVLLQKDWDAAQLEPSRELQILRIIQESLANVRKHSKAHTVRVLMRCDKSMNGEVLIEDDGVGLQAPAFSGHPGEHIGLSIMEERARKMGGELKIESEPGEGTRVQLTFSNDQEQLLEQKKQHYALI